MEETKLKNRVVCHVSKQKVTLNLNSDYFSFQGAINVSLSLILIFHN